MKILKKAVSFREKGHLAALFSVRVLTNAVIEADLSLFQLAEILMLGKALLGKLCRVEILSGNLICLGRSRPRFSEPQWNLFFCMAQKLGP